MSRQLRDSAATVDSQSLEQALEYAAQDLESVKNLRCFPAAVETAEEFTKKLRGLSGAVLPGVRATACDAGAADQRLAKVGDSVRHLQGAEEFFETALKRVDITADQIRGAIPAGGVAFDDCRAKAQRGWARARASINKLSCEFAASLDRLDTYQRHAARAGLGALSCAAPAAAPVAQAEAPKGDAGTVMVVVPQK